MKVIRRKQAIELIENCRTEYEVRFIKKDGTVRDMKCENGVVQGITGRGMNWNPDRYGFINTYDVVKGEYRLININTLQRVKIGDDVYRVQH